MRRTFLRTVTAIVMATIGMTTIGVTTTIAQAATEADVSGEWDGGWEGAGGSGTFKLTLLRGADGKLSGGVSVGQADGDYKATFTSVSLVDGKLVAKYDYTPDPQAEIALTGTVTGTTLKGEWKMLPKGQEMELAAGTWNVTKG